MQAWLKPVLVMQGILFVRAWLCARVMCWTERGGFEFRVTSSVVSERQTARVNSGQIKRVSRCDESVFRCDEPVSRAIKQPPIDPAGFIRIPCTSARTKDSLTCLSRIPCFYPSRPSVNSVPVPLNPTSRSGPVDRMAVSQIAEYPVTCLTAPIRYVRYLCVRHKIVDFADFNPISSGLSSKFEHFPSIFQAFS